MGIKIKLSKIISNYISQKYSLEKFQIQIRKNIKSDTSYQTDCLFYLSKILNLDPKEIFIQIEDELRDLFFSIFKVEFSGKGFMNIDLMNNFVTENINEYNCYNYKKCVNPFKIVVDYGGPNVAKEMHVGHLRSLIIGDAISRILEFAGNEVIRQNHLGDWGMQFGFLIEYIVKNKVLISDNLSITDLNEIYQNSKIQFDNDEIFQKDSRARLNLLQFGDNFTIGIWQKLKDITIKYINEICKDLNILLTEEDAKGESFYNFMLKDIIHELENLGLCVVDQGAKVFFLKHSEDNIDPVIIQKSDGSFLYITTDIAAVKYRVDVIKANKIIYITDSRQKQHFQSVFQICNIAGFSKNTELYHLGFGSVLGEDKKPFKTRSGENIKLKSLIKEAQNRSKNILLEKRNLSNNNENNEYFLDEVSNIIGVGAIKYSDLKDDLTKDYIFSFDSSISFNGNTSVYIQNAFIRILSMFNKIINEVTNIINADLINQIFVQIVINIDDQIDDEKIRIKDDQYIKLYLILERILEKCKFQIKNDLHKKISLKTLEFHDVIDSITSSFRPHHLCTYLLSLASFMHEIYESIIILDIKNIQNLKDVKDQESFEIILNQLIDLNTLKILKISMENIKCGLNLIGIGLPNNM